jgi:poly(A) polymerase
LHEVAADGTADAAAALVDQICRRLKLSNQESHDVSWLVGHRDALHGVQTLRKCRLKRLLAQPLIHELLALESAHAHAVSESLTDVEFCQNYLRTTPTEEINPPPLITGDDLISLGIEPGPQFKEILDRVRDAQLDGVISTRDEALGLIRQ